MNCSVLPFLLFMLLVTAAGAAVGQSLETTAVRSPSGTNVFSGNGGRFFDYIRNAANPDRHGLRKDGRFYPYSSAEGRRIGYRQLVSDKKMYRDGWAVADADKALKERLLAVEAELRKWLLQKKKKELNELQQESREILLDFAFTEGSDKLRPDFVDAVLLRDWKRILEPDLYARYEADWPDSVRNKAFYERWKVKLEGGK